eukprot:29172-Chlamydomonas_euryale.AAC.2
MEGRQAEPWMGLGSKTQPPHRGVQQRKCEQRRRTRQRGGRQRQVVRPAARAPQAALDGRRGHRSAVGTGAHQHLCVGMWVVKGCGELWRGVNGCGGNPQPGGERPLHVGGRAGCKSWGMDQYPQTGGFQYLHPARCVARGDHPPWGVPPGGTTLWRPPLKLQSRALATRQKPSGNDQPRVWLRRAELKMSRAEQTM